MTKDKMVFAARSAIGYLCICAWDFFRHSDLGISHFSHAPPAFIKPTGSPSIICLLRALSTEHAWLHDHPCRHAKPNCRLCPTPVGEGSGGESHGPDPDRAVPGFRLWLGQAPVLRTRPRGRPRTRHAARGLDAHGPADSADRGGCADLRSEQCGPDLQAWLYCRHQPLRHGVFRLRLLAAAKAVVRDKMEEWSGKEWRFGVLGFQQLDRKS